MSNHSFYDSRATAAGFLQEGLALGEVRLASHVDERGGRVLDVGCGSGRLHGALSGVEQLVGVDYAFAQLALYREVHPEVALVNADATRLPFSSNTFDSVLFAYHMIESVLSAESRIAAIVEAARVLQPGGQLFLTRHVRRNYRLGSQIGDYLARRVDEFGDVRGRGSNHAGGVSLDGFTMHILSDSEMQRMAEVARLKAFVNWDFDDGGRRRDRSRAIVQVFFKV